MNIESLIDLYIRLRDRRSDRKKAFDAKDAADKGHQEKIEGLIMSYFNENGIDRAGCGAGTAYRSIRTSATVADWGLTLDFIKHHEAWEMLEQRVSKKAVEEYISANEAPPPGVNVSRESVINVRRT